MLQSHPLRRRCTISLNLINSQNISIFCDILTACMLISILGWFQVVIFSGHRFMHTELYDQVDTLSVLVPGIYRGQEVETWF